jgi:hypothetical protein
VDDQAVYGCIVTLDKLVELQNKVRHCEIKKHQYERRQRHYEQLVRMERDRIELAHLSERNRLSLSVRGGE